MATPSRGIRQHPGDSVNTSDLQRRRELLNLSKTELIERVSELEHDLDTLNHAFEVGAFDGR